MVQLNVIFGFCDFLWIGLFVGGGGNLLVGKKRNKNILGDKLGTGTGGDNNLAAAKNSARQFKSIINNGNQLVVGVGESESKKSIVDTAEI